MKKPLILILFVFTCVVLAAQPQQENRVSIDSTVTESTLAEIRIIAGNSELNGILYDNETAKAFLDMLPYTVQLWHPAVGFARAFDLPARIDDYQPRTRSYEKGGLAYWYEGPSVAIFYTDALERTVVPVVTIGKSLDDVSIFEMYGAEITIERR